MGNGVCLIVCLLFCFLFEFPWPAVEYNGVAVGFSVGVSLCALCCCFGWSSCVDWLAWLFGLTMITMTLWILLFFCLLRRGNLLSRIMSMHCIQGRGEEEKNRTFQKIKILKTKAPESCTCGHNLVGRNDLMQRQRQVHSGKEQGLWIM